MIKKKIHNIIAYIQFFFIQFSKLPAPLLRRSISTLFIGLGIAFFSGAMISVFAEWGYAIGFLAAIYIAYPFYSITKDYYEGTIISIDAECTKIKRGTFHYKDKISIGDRTMIYMKNLENHKEEMFYSYISKRKFLELSEGFTYTIYISQNNPDLILGWDFLGSGTKS